MHVLSTTDSQHTLKLVPRLYLAPTSLKIKDKYTSVDTFIEIDSYANGNYMIITFSKEVEEEEKGEIEIKSDDVVIYRGMYLVTSQNIKDYDLSENAYTYYDGQ